MKVKVISLTQSPVDVLLFTKNTRLNMTADNMNVISKMSKDSKEKELEYMVDTIRSSWEFVDYTIAIEGVTRAFTHQLVRNRHGSYAQQTMRILDVSGFDYLVGPTIEADPDLVEIYCEAMAYLNYTYNLLIEKGSSIEDARGVLPTNIKTNIVAKFNLRTLVEIISARSSNRTQDEYQNFISALKEAVVKVTPWADMFLNSRKHFAAQHLQSYVESNMADKDDKIFTLKMIDLLRK